MACTLDTLLTSLFPRGALWRRAPGRTKWVRIGTYDTIADAVTALFEQQSQRGGNFHALAEGVDPNTEDDGG